MAEAGNTMSVDDFLKWVTNAQPGESVVYRTGLSFSKEGGRAIDSLAFERACTLARPHGQVELKQRLLNRDSKGIGVYHYIATKLR